MNDIHATGLMTSILDRVLGRGRHAVTVPPMDGALQPNNMLDRAARVAQAVRPDNLVRFGDQLLFSSGPDLYAVGVKGGPVASEGRLDGDVCAMASMPDGRAVAISAHGRVHSIGHPGAVQPEAATALQSVRCPTAMAAVDDRTLIVTDGSSRHRPDQWRADLLRSESSGSVWRLDIGTGEAKKLASGLAYPAGVALHRDGALVVSEAWAHRLVKIGASGNRTVLLDDLPGYPSRLSPAADGGYWLCLFAPRSQLVEFVLREREYRERMMAEIEERYWVAPALSSGRDFREPMQGGAIKSMGMLKPWAPTRSYGLVCKLDADFQPQWSAHSRADGRRHGVTSTVELDGRLYACSQGGDEIVALPV